MSQVEGRDYVVCRECGHQGAKLYRHVESAHGLTTTAYIERHSDAPLRCNAAKALQTATRAARIDATPKTWRDTKEVLCPSCGKAHLVGKTMGSRHDLRCSECKESARDSLWVGKVEGVGFIQCLECPHRAENLTSHVTHAHPGYRDRHPEATLVALRSAVRDKTALIGLVRSEDFCRKIAEAKTLGLTLDDFRPFLEVDGTVDHQSMEEAIGVDVSTLHRYADGLGLRFTDKYRKAAGIAKRVVLTIEDLNPFRLKNGRVSVTDACTGLGFSWPTVRNECRRLGLPTVRNQMQWDCLEAISRVLGGLPFEEEWTGHGLRSEKNYFFKYDGFFPSIGLVVEVHGHQHWKFPNAFLRDESYRPRWEKMLEHDAIKEAFIRGTPGLSYMVVREDEPFTDPTYLAGRLKQVGVLESG